MTTYDENKVQLVVNRMDNDCWEHLSSKSNEEIYIVGSNPSGVVKIDLDAVEMVQASVSTMASAISANTSSIAGLASSVSAMTSTMTGLESSISAVAGSLNVSGIGCSTITLSGTYSDSTSFAYNVVIQPSA